MSDSKSSFIQHCMFQFAPELKINYFKSEKHSEQLTTREELN